jgi:import inner membrane translocase subunit TIM8
MSAADQLSVEQSDIEKLNDKDKSELRQFFSNEEQRARIQSRMSLLSLLSSQTYHITTSNSLRNGHNTQKQNRTDGRTGKQKETQLLTSTP